ncbi:hypothetical protein HDF17_000914 [Granulicella arctica]|uniref:Uncharacterized protein n=1 Tax=Granulicella arctica TaxID=940613 RepID=A0A7Y9TJU1_9BACT|nr:hypothetical protein [Granulicella arctica]
MPHLRDGLIVAKVGIVRSTTVLFHQPQNSVILSEVRSTQPKDLRLPLPLLVLPQTPIIPAKTPTVRQFRIVLTVPRALSK